MSVPTPTVTRLRDLMTHRGPDGMGLFESPGVALGHRRLSIIDPTPAGDQPMRSPCERYVLVYNGELYNDAELRTELTAEGVRFRSHCDTETLLHALIRWGTGASERVRGMYAFGFVDLVARTAILARDPLGIKPLFWTIAPDAGGGPELVFASEPAAVLGHPGVAKRPDPVVVASYLATIRTTLGDRTMFDRVRTLLPGEWRTVDFGAETISAQARITEGPVAGGCSPDVDGCRAIIGDAVQSHLRSDVPLCALLSGGLDSTIIAALARAGASPLNTYCAGAATDDPNSDLAFAARAAAELGTAHHEAPVDEPMFHERWRWMVERLAVPLSTPNEVAINEVARLMQADGRKVTLSGEGADELFGGYDVVLRGVVAEEQRYPDCSAAERSARRAQAYLRFNTWIAPEMIARIWRGERSAPAAIAPAYADHYALAEARRDGDPLGVHLDVLTRVNLEGLLRRLDTATMLESVEGRTPFADSRVASWSRTLPAGLTFDGTTTKVVLRRAFERVVPADVLARPKASFPLPFQQWIEHAGATIWNCTALREWIDPVCVGVVAQNPREHWRLAWPMANLALWLTRL